MKSGKSSNANWQKAAWVGVGATMGVALSLAITVDANRDAKSTIPLDELRTFSEVFARVKNDYVEPISDKKLIESAINGMVSSLDPHSVFLDENAYKDLQSATTGKFGGIGAEIGSEDGMVKVIAPIDDTPAARAGIRAGDLIVKIDDESTRGLTVQKAVERIRGNPGTSVKLEVFRKDTRTTHNFALTREEIKIQSVKAKVIEPGILHARIRTFSETTVPDLSKALRDAEAKGPLKGVVLDLRSNPGGVLGSAIGMSAMFLPKESLVVYTEGRIEGSKNKYYGNRAGMSPRVLDALSQVPESVKTVPVVVLTNGGSASASEIVAGALQDHKRATVMGTTTFGKGSVQNIIPLSATSGVKLTTQRYYTPNGRSIQGTGIEPDVLIEQLTFDGVMSPKTTREKDLSRHLVGKDEKKDAAADEDTSDEAQEAKLQKVREDQKKLKGFDWGNEKDFLFAQAVNQLKGLPVVRSTVEANSTSAKAVVPAK